MSTHYIMPRGTKLDRKQIFKHFDQSQLLVSVDNQKDGHTIHNTPNLGIQTGDGTIWAQMDGNRVCGFEIYSSAHNGDAVDDLSSVLGITLISEHDDEYARETFPVDVTATSPNIVRDGWWLFLVDGRYYPYHSTNQLFYHHLDEEQSIVDADIQEYIDVLNEEL